ncbi:hypothetical protein DEO72_LG11g2192 [Vigna unguiculata]|uniref:Uncharacterized protein n=1 Tax=Vigna unguiculata TaxID=3917 RepID=A0A4D6NMX7_VIGUN|nr:hypothetical protein DEO72_LG11g2192 [Vigna unguiculata]
MPTFRKKKPHLLELLLLPSSARVPKFLKFTFSLAIVLLTVEVPYEPISRKTVARPANLAQASQSRLGEMDRDSPKPFYVKGHPGDQLIFLGSEYLAQARGVSPKRDPALALVSLFEPSPRRRGLAWARTSRLSEGLGETVRYWVALLLLDD